MERETMHHDAARQAGPSEPIAILAMACRMPGRRHSPAAFWQGLLESYRPVQAVSPQRRRLGLQVDDADIPGGFKAAFLEDIDRFDSAFFGISPREAGHMDPQHRLFLEVAVEALDAAGQPWERLAGSRTGVFMGIYSNEYSWLPSSAASSIDVHSASGAGPGIAPNRLSYLLDLRGPSLAIDTTCSSSLVAAHLAVQSLRSGESNLAVVGGASLILSPEVVRSVAHSIPIAADGRCKTFSAAADGTVRGEGCVVLVLKRLRDALADADPVAAVIVGSAVNQDGRSNGLTAPNPEAQKQLIALALQDAGVGAHQMAYLEAHGTATQLGDAIELEAAMQVLAADGRRRSPCLIGSVKANIGHLEAAAGVAGLMRAALTLQFGVNAPHPLDGLPHPLLQQFPQVLAVATRRSELSCEDGAVVGVSAFSLGGTNAHLVLAKAPAPDAPRPVRDAKPAKRPYLIPISARSASALSRRVQQLGNYIASGADRIDLHDLAYTACERRTHHPYRHTFVASSLADLQREMTYASSSAVGNRTGPAGKAAARVAFVFPGHGCQWQNMARDLMAAEPVFRRAIERFDAVVAAVGGWSLLEFLAGDASEAQMSSSTHGQPALVAMELAIAELLRTWGIVPAAVVGYSAGETAAMVMAGMISEEQAMRACVQRGRALEELAAGGMLAVRLDENDARQALSRAGGALALAAVNGPQTAIVAGSLEDLARLRRDLEARDVLCIDAGVPYLFHHPAARHFVARTRGDHAVGPIAEPRLPIYSSVLGRRLRQASELDPRYWERALCDTLRFADTVGAVLDDGVYNFVEISPSPTLIADIRDVIRENGATGVAVPTLRRYGEAPQHLAAAAAALFDVGYPLSFQHFLGSRGRCLPWPGYPWEDGRFWWPESAGSAAVNATHRARPAADPSIATPEGSGAFDDIAYGLCWQHSVALIAAPVEEASGSDKSLDLERRCMALADRPAIHEYAAIEPQIDAACAGYAAQALLALGVQFEPQHVIHPEQLEQELGLDEARQRLLRHLCEMLAIDGYLSPQEQRWVVVRKLPPFDADAVLQLLSGAHPSLSVELALLARCGPRLAEVLAGRLDPLTLLFPNSDIEAAAALFGESGIAAVMNGLAETATAALRAAHARGRPFRVLEIGAGTGGTTKALRAALDGANVEYCYTDISRTLLRFAARRFADWPALQTRVLDISLDPLEQDFAAGAYDLIVAANVLHATATLSDTLRNIRRLLAPGGSLLIIEATRAQRIIDLTFGLTKDWWGYRDTELRAKHPLLAAAAWCELLAEAGFKHVEVVPRGDELAERLDMSLFVCRGAADPVSLPRARQRWLLIAEGCETTAALASRMAAEGHECRIATIAEAPGAVAAGTWQGIVDLRCLSVNSDETWSAQRLMQVQRELHEGLLRTVHALARSGSTQLRMVFVTRCAFDVGGKGGPADVVQATLCGCIAALAAEHPHWRPTVIDCEPAAPQVLAQRIWAELCTASGQPQLAYRGGSRMHALLERAHTTRADLSKLVYPDRSYLVTGGLGALGFEIVEWLASLGARHLILAQRTALAPAAMATRIRALEQAGVRIELRSVDLSKVLEVTQLVAHLNQHAVPLAGVIHTAGSFDDCLLVNQDWSGFERVLAPKVVGAWELHRALADSSLDFFVLFSSAAQLLDPVGMANYVAANAFLEALAARRRACGMPATCIGWGGWTDLGMAQRMSQSWEKRWTRRGVRGLDTRRSFDALAWAIAAGPPVVHLMDVNWQQLAAVASEDQRRMFAAILPAPSAPAPTAKARVAALRKQPAEPALARIMKASRADRAAAVAALVRRHVLDVLQLPDDFVMDGETPLADLGLDSLMALELRDALAADLSMALPATLSFDHPTLGALGRFVLQQIRMLETPPAAFVAVGERLSLPPGANR
jgi:microcystin synthetase protein McyG